MSTKLGDLTITKQSGTVLTLSTDKRYVNDNVYFNIGVQQGAGAVTIASTDAEIQTDANVRNISGSIGTKATSAPSSGYYFKVGASGTGSSTITTAGWLDTGSMGTATASESYYFPIDTAVAATSGTNTVTPSASLSGSNVTLSNTNNGISVTSIGGGSASATIDVSITDAGYVGEGSLDSSTVDAQSTTTTASSYISGVTIPVPSSGTNTFTVTVPNGENDTVTFTFSVDSSGNTEII